MLRIILLKFKRALYINILGIFNIFALIGLIGCSNNPNSIKDKTADSIARVKKMNDSIANGKIKQDSLIEAKKRQDSIAREDSIKKAAQLKQNFKPIKHPTKYGAPPIKH